MNISRCFGPKFCRGAAGLTNRIGSGFLQFCLAICVNVFERRVGNRGTRSAELPALESNHGDGHVWVHVYEIDVATSWLNDNLLAGREMDAGIGISQGLMSRILA